MDKEILDAIRSKLVEVNEIIAAAIEQLDDVEASETDAGKVIAYDFDDTDLTNIQMSIDDSVSRLNDLSVEIETLLIL